MHSSILKIITQIAFLVRGSKIVFQKNSLDPSLSHHKITNERLQICILDSSVCPNQIEFIHAKDMKL